MPSQVLQRTCLPLNPSSSERLISHIEQTSSQELEIFLSRP